MTEDGGAKVEAWMLKAGDKIMSDSDDFAKDNAEHFAYIIASCAPAPTPAPRGSAKPTGLSPRFNALLKSYGVLFHDDAMRSRLIIDLEQEVALASRSVPGTPQEETHEKPE